MLLDLSRVAFTKINGELKPPEKGKENHWDFNNKCVLTVLREKFLPETFDFLVSSSIF